VPPGFWCQNRGGKIRTFRRTRLPRPSSTAGLGCGFELVPSCSSSSSLASCSIGPESGDLADEPPNRHVGRRSPGARRVAADAQQTRSSTRRDNYSEIGGR
jgi:hypothetical protein